MEGNNGSIVDDNLSPVPPDRERIVILDAGSSRATKPSSFLEVI